MITKQETVIEKNILLMLSMFIYIEIVPNNERDFSLKLLPVAITKGIKFTFYISQPILLVPTYL